MQATCKYCPTIIDYSDNVLDKEREAREMAGFGEAVYRHMASFHPQLMQLTAEFQVMFSSWNLLRHVEDNPELESQRTRWSLKLVELLVPPPPPSDLA